MDWLNMINMSNTACRNCQHWVMDESRCSMDTAHYQAKFGFCMFLMPDLPFWSCPPLLGGVIQGRMTDAGAGATCKTFEGRTPIRA